MAKAIKTAKQNATGLTKKPNVIEITVESSITRRKNPHRNGNVIFVAPVGYLGFRSFAAVPTKGMLRAVHEKCQR